MLEISFEGLGLTKGICKILGEIGYSAPTDIQKLAIPPLLAGQDLIGIAPTGTGKTLAYLLPIFQYLRKNKIDSSKGPVALVVAPSRELAQQVARVAKNIEGSLEETKVVCVFGGSGLTIQKKELEGKPSVVVGTPGRIRELYSTGELVLKSVKFLVLDEADRLMDMGFTPQLRAMLEVLPLKRQTLLFSATFNQRVEKATEEFLEWPVKVQAAKQATVPTTIEERFIRTANKATKKSLLLLITRNAQEGMAGFVFCRTRQEANEVTTFLQAAQVSASVLHANKGQNTRQAVLEDFKNGTIAWLVTTDVSSRGLDIPEVPTVIQYGLPVDIRDYVHRTGRTGRAGVLGISHAFIDPADESRLPALQKLLGKSVSLFEPPSEIIVSATPREEAIEYERAKDDVRKALDPTFKGAFHEKQRPIVKEKRASLAKDGSHNTTLRTRKSKLTESNLNGKKRATPRPAKKQK